jgi:hypothetical protein
LKESGQLISKIKLLKEIKEFRSLIKSKLVFSNLMINEPVVSNKGQYSRIELDYQSLFLGKTGLRPHILLEFTLAHINLPVVSLFVKTLIEETLRDVILSIPCAAYSQLL